MPDQYIIISKDVLDTTAAFFDDKQDAFWYAERHAGEGFRVVKLEEPPDE